MVVAFLTKWFLIPLKFPNIYQLLAPPHLLLVQREKNREPKPDKSKTKKSKSEDQKGPNFSMEPTKTSTLPEFANVNNVESILGSNSYGSMNLLPQFDSQPNSTF